MPGNRPPRPCVENHSQTTAIIFALLGPRGFMRELQAAQSTLGLIPVSAPCFFAPLPACAIIFSTPCWRELGLTLAAGRHGGSTPGSVTPGVCQNALLQ